MRHHRGRVHVEDGTGSTSLRKLRSNFESELQLSQSTMDRSYPENPRILNSVQTSNSQERFRFCSRLNRRTMRQRQRLANNQIAPELSKEIRGPSGTALVRSLNCRIPNDEEIRTKDLRDFLSLSVSLQFSLNATYPLSSGSFSLRNGAETTT